MRALLAFVAACHGAPAPAPKPAPLDWHGRSIYFVVTDRFANGDPSNDNAEGFASNRADPRAWHGGDLRGVIDHLDYIAGMGFTGIWITPVIAQHDAHAYHGYWGWDWSRVDPHLGDMATLRELVDKAHARGIAVMIDTVANHTGRYQFKAPSFPDASMYHHNGDIKNYSDPIEVENNALSGLDDLAQENPVVHDKLLEHVRWLVRESGADGLRVDTVKHVPKAFWTDWVAAAHTFTIGEVLDGSVDANAPYAHILSATLDYPMYYAIGDAFAKGGSARRLGDILAQDDKYADARLQGVFVDNHDQPRFLCKASEAQLRLALTFTFTVRGIPILYYGTEQGLHDCDNNREDLPTADTSAPLYRYVSQLNAIRASSEALRVGVQHERWRDDTVYAFERDAGASVAVVGFNTGPADRTLTVKHVHGGTFHDALGGASATIEGDQLTFTIPATGAVILVP